MKQIHIISVTTQQVQGIESMLFYCWPSVYDAWPTLKQHRVMLER